MDSANKTHRTSGHVFISYARNDGVGKEWAIRIQARLEGLGIPAWRDETDIEPAGVWPTEIATAIDNANALLCVLSNGVGESHWMAEEADYARTQGTPIIPLRVEANVEPLFGIRTLQCIDFTGADDDPWGRLVEWLDSSYRSPRRRIEVAYLQDLLYRHELEKVEKIYTPLPAEQVRHLSLARVLPESCMPVEFELLRALVDTRQGAEKQPFDDVLDALRQAPRLAVLGEPGAGKTFALRRIAAEQARQALEQPDVPVPIFVPLKEWIDANVPLHNFIAEHSGKLERHWSALLEEQRVYLLLDGLNELPTAQRKNKMQAIRELVNDKRLPVVVASCRRDDFVDELRLDLDTLDIRPLDPPRIHAFITRYLTVLDPQQGAERGETLFWHLAGGKGVQDAWRAWQAANGTFEQFWSVEDAEKDIPKIFEKIDWLQDFARRWAGIPVG